MALISFLVFSLFPFQAAKNASIMNFKNVNIINSYKNSTDRGESENIDEISNSLNNDISGLINLRKDFLKNSVFSYLNINSLEGKFDNL